MSKVGVLHVPGGKPGRYAPVPGCDVDLVCDLGLKESAQSEVDVTLAFGSGRRTLTVASNGRTKTVEIPCESVVPYVGRGGHYVGVSILKGSWSTCE